MIGFVKTKIDVFRCPMMLNVYSIMYMVATKIRYTVSSRHAMWFIPHSR